MLGDMGARVIKIEQRGTGDPGRYLASGGGVESRDKPNWYFESNNRNKESITVDLKQPEGREIILALAEKADIFVQNYRLGVAARLGLDYESLKARNSKIIYASATGYGPKGDEAAEPSFDYLGLARSGIMNAAGEPDMNPQAIAGGIADQMGAIMLAYGVLNAVIARERFGIGQEVNSSHLGSMTFLQGLAVSMKLMAGKAMPRSFRSEAYNPLWNHYRCADDRWIALAMLQSDRYWSDFCRVIERPELANDNRFTDMDMRRRNRKECVAVIDAAFARRPLSEWMQRLKDDPGDFIYTMVSSVDDLPEDPQVIANNYIVDFEHPQLGPTKMVGVPVELSETPGSIRRAAPELGQDTELVLMDILGWDWDRISQLKRDEAI